MNTTTTNKAPKFSAGKKVQVTRAGKSLGVGRYLGSTQRKNGTWHQVNLAAPRQTPNVINVRTANLARA